jgi:hypothetical protein
MAAERRILLRQRMTPVVHRYALQTLYPNGNRGTMLARAQQKPFTMKRQVTFFRDEAQTQAVFGFAARGAVMHGTYDITDADGQPIGEFRKDFATSLMRSTWTLSTPDGLSAVGRERSGFVAFARRLLEAFTPFGLRFHFDFVTDDGQVVLSSEREPTIRDEYIVTIPVLSDGRQLDWRVAAAMAVALDAFEGR